MAKTDKLTDAVLSLSHSEVGREIDQCANNWLQVFSEPSLCPKARLATISSDTSELCRMLSLWHSIWRKANLGGAFPRN